MPTKVHIAKAMIFAVVMYGYKSWIIKKAECWRVDAFKLRWRRLDSPLACKEIKPVNPKEIFIGRTDVEAETPVCWPPDMKSWLIGKDPDSGRDWRQKEKWMTEWDGWMASLTQWTLVWENSRRQWRTETLGVLQSVGSQRVRHDWTAITSSFILLLLEEMFVLVQTLQQRVPGPRSQVPACLTPILTSHLDSPRMGLNLQQFPKWNSAVSHPDQGSIASTTVYSFLVPLGLTGFAW